MCSLAALLMIISSNAALGVRQGMSGDYWIVIAPARTTFDDLPEYMALGGHCRECDRHALKRKWPADKHFLSALAPKLRCRACGNKQHNS
jgi:hypothetical protein